jgi:23S rRNA (adenine2503-C2)-methyltransferase
MGIISMFTTALSMSFRIFCLKKLMTGITIHHLFDMDTTTPDKLIDLKSLTPREIDRFCARTLGQRAGQGTRVAVRLYRRKVEDIDAMADMNRPFREQLKRACMISTLLIEQHSTSEDGTQKLLYRLDDGNTIEGVLIPGPGGRFTLCLSSQVGCASGCGFCLTGSNGLVRNLTVPEIVNQVFAAQKIAGTEITNLVLMGTGEPLSNYESVRSFIEIATDRNGMGFSPRKVTLSTCGLAPMIEKLADDGVEVSLAVSLNATTDEIRDTMMPINKTGNAVLLQQDQQDGDDRICALQGNQRFAR